MRDMGMIYRKFSEKFKKNENAKIKYYIKLEKLCLV